MLSILVGIIVTIMVQSSSITTSLLVPLAGAGLITLVQAFPITLGANIGTTVTALLASMAASGENAQSGVVIALVHFLFNITGTVMVYPVPAIRNLPLAAAARFADFAVRSRKWAVAYVPFLVLRPPGCLCVPRPILEVIRRVSMLQELLKIFKSGDALSGMANDFAKMLKLSCEMTATAGAIYFHEPVEAGDRTRIYEKDVEVNKLERTIRKRVVTHVFDPR